MANGNKLFAVLNIRVLLCSCLTVIDKHRGWNTLNAHIRKRQTQRIPFTQRFVGDMSTYPENSLRRSSRIQNGSVLCQQKDQNNDSPKRNSKVGIRNKPISKKNVKLAVMKRNESISESNKNFSKRISKDDAGVDYDTEKPLKRRRETKSGPQRKILSMENNGVRSSAAETTKGTRIYATDLEKISPQNCWIDLQIPPPELRASATLTTGQCFNWVVVQRDDLNHNESITSEISSSAWGNAKETQWIGAITFADIEGDGKVDLVLSIRETSNTTMYRVLHGLQEGISPMLKDYFQLEIPLCSLYQEWSENDERLAKIAGVIPGLRIVRQTPVECLFSFICSSNNNIPRITKMLSALRKKYGRKLLDVPMRVVSNKDELTLSSLPMEIYSFPTLQELLVATEEELREMGLGYRAKYIIQTRDLLFECGGEEFLLSLRSKDAETVQKELLRFSGIGRKVADCVALFSLDQSSAIPVDIHVQHIASRDYDPTILGTAKSLTPTIYKRVGDLFQDKFGVYAGWAHSLLFVAELPSFRDVLPKDILVEMDEWRQTELRRKAALKKEKIKAANKK